MILKIGLSNATKIGNNFDIDANLELLHGAIKEADEIIKSAKISQSKVSKFLIIDLLFK